MNLSHLPTFMGLVSAIALTWGDVNAAEGTTKPSTMTIVLYKQLMSYSKHSLYH